MQNHRYITDDVILPNLVFFFESVHKHSRDCFGKKITNKSFEIIRYENSGLLLRITNDISHKRNKVVIKKAL